MKKAITPNKAFSLFTLFFIAIAVLSFASFQETEALCNEIKKCTQLRPAPKNGQMIWDVFSQGLISLVSFR
ncbi:MAG TPA: hypothetical protein VEY10_04910 [Flavisolibacter sp.]|jgi:hypothetical protein|nr:hypothetical protein [Flavisolibacter sp.]